MQVMWPLLLQQLLVVVLLGKVIEAAVAADARPALLMKHLLLAA
jgi:hypothetical protein